MAFAVREPTPPLTVPETSAKRVASIRDLGAWERRVLETILALGESAHDEAILKQLQGAGHKSLKLNTLELPLKRLARRGIITSQRIECRWQNTVRELRFWSIKE